MFLVFDLLKTLSWIKILINTTRNAKKKVRLVNISHFFRKLLSNWFWTLGKCMKVKLQVFYFGTSRGPKSVLKPVLYNYCSKKNLERFGEYLKKWKNGFPIVFSQCDLAGGTSFFIQTNSEKAKHLRICLSIVSKLGETCLCWCPIITRP